MFSTRLRYLNAAFLLFLAAGVLLTDKVGHAAVTAEGDALFDNGQIQVAEQFGDGSLTISPPDTLNTGGIFIASGRFGFNGSDLRPTGTVTVDGATVMMVNGFEIAVGGAGRGTLIIQNGGRLESNSSSIDFLVSGDGSVQIRGAGSQLDLPRGSAFVGGTRTSTFLVEDGGQAILENLALGGGNFDSSLSNTGLATVQGPGSNLEILRDLSISMGVLRIENGAQVTGGVEFGSTARIGGNPFNNSSDFVESGAVYVDGTGSSWLQNGSLELGSTGSGGLHISNGGFVSSGQTVIAGSTDQNPFNGSPSGIVTIDGAGSRLHTQGLSVGENGDGQIIVSNGATLQNNSPFFDQDTSIGGGPNGFGRLIVDGINSRWIDNSETVGIGNGELLIRNGAVVSSPATEVTNGLVRITGSTTRWRVANIQLGNMFGNPNLASRGTVEISDGATVELLANPFGGSFPSEFEINQGSELVLSDGRLTSTFIGAGNEIDVMNRGIVRGSGEISVVFRNAVEGNVRVGNGDRLALGASASNNGTIDITGGELDARSSFLNNPGGTISLQNATVRVGESDVPNAAPVSANAGRIVIAGGVNRVYGNLENRETGDIVASSNSETTFFGDISNAGVIRVSDGSVATFFGNLSGNGVDGGGTVFLEGNITPGFSPGVMAFGGDVTLGDFSALAIELGDEAHDMLDIAGDAALGGNLVLSALEALEGDTSFEIVSAESIVGTFDNVPAMGTELGFGVVFDSITYNEDSVIVSLLQQTADFNDDGSVDGSDLGLFSNGYSSGSTLADGDADRDGDVDGSDFLRWQREHNPAAPALAANQAVPEPTSVALLLAAGLASVALRRR